MVAVAGLPRMSKQEIKSLSAYLAGLRVGADKTYDITLSGGDVSAGKTKFENDCDTCHGKHGNGRKKKEAPPLAGLSMMFILSIGLTVDMGQMVVYRDRFSHVVDPIVVQ